MTYGTNAISGLQWNGWEYEYYNPCARGHVFRWQTRHTGDKVPPDGTVCECGTALWRRAGGSWDGRFARAQIFIHG